MKRKRLLLTVLISLLLAGVLYAGLVEASDLLPADRAIITFRHPLTQSELQNLLQEYDLTPTAIYMVNAGLVGTHRTYEVRSIDEFFALAQKSTMEGMQKGLQSNAFRLKRFIEQHSEEEVIADENLQQELRSLLNIRLQMEATLAAAQEGLPTIYAAEVTGKNMGRLQYDERIGIFQRFNLIETLISGRRAPAPSAPSQQEFVDPKIQSMGPRDLYRYAESVISPH